MCEQYISCTFHFVTSDASAKEQGSRQDLVDLFTHTVCFRRLGYSLDPSLKHKLKLRKLWQETRYPACKTAVKWVSRYTSIMRMVRKRAHENGKQSWQTWMSHLKQCGLLRNYSQKGVDQRHHLQIMVPWSLMHHILSNR
jgi:hypothetical protein